MAATTAIRNGFLSQDIDQRSGWPDELCVLLREHPRDSWEGTRSSLAQFWIQKHNHMRRQSDALQSANKDYQSGKASPEHFGTWVAPRLQGFLAELHGHHQIEDYHYFPSFKAADPRLAAGFDVLARDHEMLHDGIMTIVETVNQFIATIRTEDESNADARRHAADKYVEASALMHARLYRHLEDEEDLIIPIMLAQGD